MEITCESCQSKLKIPDGKIPPGKTAVFNCPKCKNKISVTGNEAPVENNADTEEKTIYDEVASDDYDAAEKPFDFAEEEGITALLCESDDGFKKTLTETLTLMEYHITVAENTRDALKKMRYHNYDLILLNENFDSPNPEQNGVLFHIQRMQMDTRRNIFVVLTTNRFRTMDNMAAFQKSVDVVLNEENIPDMGKILERSIREKDYFYKVYNQTREDLGLI